MSVSRTRGAPVKGAPGRSYWVTGRISDCGPGGFEAGSGLGVGFVRGVLFSLFLLSVLSTVPGIGRLSSDEAQLHKAQTDPTNTTGR
jgi:hypothetical protein